MDIIDFTKIFHKLEKERNFFSLKDKDGLYFWDVVRYDIFNLIYYNLTSLKGTEPKRSATIKEKLSDFFKCIYFSYKLSRECKVNNFNYLCFVTSRYKDKNDNYVDYAIYDILQLLERNNTLILENNIHFNGNYKFLSFFNVGVKLATYKKKIENLFKQNEKSVYEIASILTSEFNLELDLNSFIKDRIERYYVEYKYYMRFLSKVQPEKIFIVQNGVQKGLFSAANNLRIQVFEMQHGLVNFSHPLYNYPFGIDLTHLNTFPSFFLSFSSFWSDNIHFPVKKKFTIGNSFYSQQDILSKKEYDISVISANVYADDFITLLDKLLESGFEGKIMYKLHPNQFDDFDHITKYFKSYSNVCVISTQLTIKELLAKSKSILAIQSTCVYEALYNKVKVLIYKKKNYNTHKDIFNNPNVYLFDDYSKIPSIVENGYIEDSTVVFFEAFQKEVFDQILN